MDEQKIIVTLSGKDQVGIVMQVTTILAKFGVNIEDIKQTLMQGQFVMFLLGDISQSKNTFKEIKQALLDKAQELGKKVEMSCGIGDETVTMRTYVLGTLHNTKHIPYSEIVEFAKEYINKVGGFEKFAEWGLF